MASCLYMNFTKTQPLKAPECLSLNILISSSGPLYRHRISVVVYKDFVTVLGDDIMDFLLVHVSLHFGDEECSVDSSLFDS